MITIRFEKTPMDKFHKKILLSNRWDQDQIQNKIFCLYHFKKIFSQSKTIFEKIVLYVVGSHVSGSTCTYNPNSQDILHNLRWFWGGRA